MQSVLPPRPKMETRLVTPFLASVQSVFETMVSVKITTDAPHIKEAAQTNCSVLGIIGFSGELIGVMTLGFSTDVAANLVESFTGSRLSTDSPEFSDAVGELANMVAGSAKSSLGFNAGITVPSVVIGENCHVSSPRDIACVVIPCHTSLGDFFVEVCIKQNHS